MSWKAKYEQQCEITRGLSSELVETRSIADCWRAKAERAVKESDEALRSVVAREAQLRRQLLGNLEELFHTLGRL